jgi:hypothetical protein
MNTADQLKALRALAGWRLVVDGAVSPGGARAVRSKA